MKLNKDNIMGNTLARSEHVFLDRQKFSSSVEPIFICKLRLLKRGIRICMSKTSRLWLVNTFSFGNSYVSLQISATLSNVGKHFVFENIYSTFYSVLWEYWWRNVSFLEKSNVKGALVSRKLFWTCLSLYRMLLTVKTKNYVVLFFIKQVPPDH